MKLHPYDAFDHAGFTEWLTQYLRWELVPELIVVAVACVGVGYLWRWSVE